MESNDGQQESEKPEQGKSLEDFITEQLQQQRENGNVGGEQIDNQRATDFMDRALKESRRMCAEVEKSQKKLNDLHGEFGKEKFSQWTHEHAAAVLPQAQNESLNNGLCSD